MFKNLNFGSSQASLNGLAHIIRKKKAFPLFGNLHQVFRTKNVKNHSGIYNELVLHFSHQQQVLYDQGNRVYINPNIKYKGTNELSGLCGNFDGDESNDNKLPDGRSASTNAELGEGWEVGEYCTELSDSSKETACEANKDRQKWAIKGICVY